MDWLATLILTVTLLGGRTDPTSVVPSTVDPFSAARHVPAAVRVFLHVEDGATLHGLLADRPIGATMTDDFVSDALMTQWATLAETLRLAPGTLVDEALGRSATWVMRGSAPDQEWVVLTAIAPADGQRMLHTLRTRIQPARDHAQIHLLPEQDWLIGLGHGHVIVAPRQHPGLFNEVLQHLDRADQPAGRAADTLLADPALTELRKLGGGRIGYFIRPQGLVGGWSGGVLDTDGAIVRWEHLSKLDPPATAIVEHAWNTSIIGTLDDVGLAAFAEPLRTAPDLMSGFVEEMVGMPLLPADIRANLGARQLTVVGETDGRDETPATDMLLPTVARVYEVRDGALARRQLDAHVPRLLRAMEDVARRAGEAVAPLTLPTPTMLAKDEPRHVDVHALTGAFIEGSPPPIEALSVNWHVVTGPTGSWAIVSTHPTLLREIATALRTATTTDSIDEIVESVGIARGRRAAAHIESWTTNAERLVAPGDVATFRESMRPIGHVCDGFERASWQVVRPARETLRIEAILHLSPPDSARRAADPIRPPLP